MKKIVFMLMMLSIAFTLSAGGAAEPAGSSAGGPAGEVTMFAWLPDNPDIVQNWKMKFEEKYPDIRLNAQMMTGQGLIENLQPRFASNNIPDVFSFELDVFSKSQVEAGKIADIGDTKAWAEMVPAMQAAWTHAGVKYGISGGIATTFMYYNKDYFDQAGITEVPTNWDEFMVVCEKLKKAGITPLVWYGGFPNMLSNGPLSWGFANDIYTREPDVIDNLANTLYDFSDNPGWLRMYEKMAMLDDRGYLMEGFTSTDYQGGQDFFNSGDAAMLLAGTWQAAYLIDVADFETGLFIPPWNDAGSEPVVVNASETGWSVGKNDNEELGKLLLDFMFFEEFNVYQNPRGCVTPFYSTEGNVLNEKLAAAMQKLNSYPKFTDLFARVVPTVIGSEGRSQAQLIYIDKTPAEVIPLLTKAQNDWFKTK